MGVLEDFIPGLQYVWETGNMKQLKAACKTIIDGYIGRKFLEHKASFDQGTLPSINVFETYMFSDKLDFEWSLIRNDCNSIHTRGSE